MTQTSKVSIELDEIADRIERQLGLIEWIEMARMALDEIQTATSNAPSLHQQLKERDIRFGTSWERLQSEGLLQLVFDVGIGVANMRELAAKQDT